MKATKNKQRADLRKRAVSTVKKKKMGINSPGHRKTKAGPGQGKSELSDFAKSWLEQLSLALIDAFGKEAGSRLHNIYLEAFPAGYVELYSVETAKNDVYLMGKAFEENDLNLSLYKPEGASDNEVRFKIFHPHNRLPLSDVLPILEDMGLRVIDEIPHVISPAYDGVDLIMIHDFGLRSKSDTGIHIAKIKENFEEVFSKTWHGDMESDSLNSLVLNAGLDWQQIIILRTYARYLKQIKAPFSLEYMEQALCNNPVITSRIVRLFEAYFDPAAGPRRNVKTRRLGNEINKYLEAVESADEDRILRRFLNGVESTARTNFYQMADDGGPKPYLSIKLDCGQIDDLPLPRPLWEIFVYSPRFEAIHLRGGMVARGGLRWSDRPEDFRTEILGLVKAQMVKNAVIVPVGSKGGFVVKRSPATGSRQEYVEEGVACYKMFMSGMLDITDNYKGAKVKVRAGVVRRDTDDPYLVVAADKGTATFSDIANRVSAQYGHWLGDAYASGGSVGYDHKKMGITAKGAWESVKRHFREVGKDIQTENFTVVGIGDMSGDVFGNGMLLSRHIKLLGAFNHMHIFVDPNPDPVKSYVERKRMFSLPRSTWLDYNKSLLSKGGGIFDRSAKFLNLSSEIRKRFGLSTTRVTPNELIQILLTAEVELLWFGGIGTYIKATSESNQDADDRANDSIRVNAPQLNCQIIGEGANLGVTQLGRIEFAKRGGRLNTDSVDNSAGVDCSDYEVNIKILLDAVVEKKKLTQNKRNSILEEMTDEVAGLVLRHNYLQTQSMTIVKAQDETLLDMQARFVRSLERSGRLNRAVEFLPDDETLADMERNNEGLTRPEIAIVMPYAKLWMYDEILDSDLPDAKELEQDLVNYFPTPLRQKYRAEIYQHRLRREIISTVITNSMINRVGGTFVTNLVEKSGASPIDIARAYLAVRDSFDLESIWAEIELLDNKVSADAQVTLFLNVNQLIERATLWLLRHSSQPINIGRNVREFRSGIQKLSSNIENIAPKEVSDRVEYRANLYKRAGVPEKLAKRSAYLLLLVSALDIIRISTACKMNQRDTARLYFRVGEEFGLGWLRYSSEKLPADNHWQKLAAAAMIEELYNHQRSITLRIFKTKKGKGDLIANWKKENGPIIEKTSQMIEELKSAEMVDLSMLAVASRNLSAIAGS